MSKPSYKNEEELAKAVVTVHQYPSRPSALPTQLGQFHTEPLATRRYLIGGFFFVFSACPT